MTTSNPPTQLKSLHDWIGRQEHHDDCLSVFPANALASSLNDESPFIEGDALPPLWHWLYFLSAAKQSELGQDGHPQRGGFLPPVALPRRMWAGGNLQWHRPLKLGENLRRVSTIQSIEQKQGKTGELVFVKVLHEIFDAMGLAMQEVHDIVYRDHSRQQGPVPFKVNDTADHSHEFSQEIIPDSVLLFRYSALTFNGHRIHYDRQYATEQEGYPGLIVHGPLVATLLAELLRKQKPKARWLSFRFKALAPMIDNQVLRLCGRAIDGTTYGLWAENDQGSMTMSAQAVIDES